MNDNRSACPINLSVELLGDTWTLLILRDMIFGGRRHFNDILVNSEEGIASNILAARLKRLQAAGMLTRRSDPTHKQKAIYSLSDSAIELVPVLATLGAWGSRWLPVSTELSIRAEVLADGGPAIWDRFMAELRCEHLGDSPGAPPDGPSVRDELQDAYQSAVNTSVSTESSQD